MEIYNTPVLVRITGMGYVLALLILTFSGTYSQNHLIEEDVPVSMAVIEKDRYTENLNGIESSTFMPIIKEYIKQVTTNVSKDADGTKAWWILRNPTFSKGRFTVKFGSSHVFAKLIANDENDISVYFASDIWNADIKLTFGGQVSGKTTVATASLNSASIWVDGDRYGVTARSDFELFVQMSWRIKIQKISLEPTVVVQKDSFNVIFSLNTTEATFSVSARESFYLGGVHIFDIVGLLEDEINSYFSNEIKNNNLVEMYSNQMKMAARNVVPPNPEVRHVKVRTKKADEKTIGQEKILIRIIPGHDAPQDARTL